MHGLMLALDFPPNRPGGMSNHLAGIANAYPGDGMVVLTDPAYSPVDHQCRVYRLPARKFIRNPALSIPFWTRAASRIIRKESIELVHCGNLSPFRHVAYYLKKKLGTPYVLYVYGNDVYHLHKRITKGGAKADKTRVQLNAASAIVANSSFTRDLTSKLLGCDKNKIIVSNPGVDDCYLDLTTHPPAIDRGAEIRLVSAGRLTARKGFDRVIEAVAQLCAEGFNVSYTIIGKGDQSSYVRLARQHGVEGRIHFTGFVQDNSKVLEILGNSHIFCMVSRLENESDVEGFGIVFLEANALRLPVVGSKSGGIPDAVLDGKTGVLVDDPDSPAEIAAAIRKLIDNPDMARTMGENGHRRVNEHFSWNVIAAKLDAAIRGL